jgi:hypothetical protein
MHPCFEGVVAKGNIKMYYIPSFYSRVINGWRKVMIRNRGQDARRKTSFMGAV